MRALSISKLSKITKTIRQNGVELRNNPTVLGPLFLTLLIMIYRRTDFRGNNSKSSFWRVIQYKWLRLVAAPGVAS